MTADQYLHAIVAKYTVESGPASDGEREACALVRLTSEWAGRDATWSGSSFLALMKKERR